MTLRSSSGSSSLDTSGYGGGEGQGLGRLRVEVLVPDSLVLAPVPVPPSVAASLVAALLVYSLKLLVVSPLVSLTEPLVVILFV